MMKSMTNGTLTQFTTDQITIERSRDYMRWLQTLYSCNGSELAAVEDYALRYPRSLSGDLIKQIPQLLMKSASTPGTSIEPAWAAPLAVPKPLPERIVADSRARSLIGQFGNRVRRVPLNISIPAQTGGATFSWVAPGGVLPVGSMALNTLTLPPAVAGGILIVTKELMTVSTPSVLTTLENELVHGLATFLDDALLSTNAANAATGAPAGLLSAAPSFGSAGSSSANAQTDLKKLIGDFTTTNPGVESLAIIMSPSVAAKLAIATGSTTLTVQGGSIYGVPVFTSASAGSRVIAVDLAALVVGDNGDVDIDISKAASVELSTTPTSPTVAGTILISLFASGMVGLRCRRYLNFKLARTSAILFSKHELRVMAAMTHKQARSMDAIADATIGVLKKSLAPRDAQISSLQQLVSELREKVAALESKPSMKFCGPWRSGTTYAFGDVAQHRGRPWLCVQAHVSGEAFAHTHFKLLAKDGEKP